MKRVLLALLVLGGCSSWNQKDFKKELNKTSAETTPNVVVSTKADEKILEKFEVTPVDEATVESAKPLPKKVTKKIAFTTKKNNKVETKIVTTTKIETPKEKKLPKDYPPAYVKVNEKAKEVWSLYQSNHFVGEKTYLDIHYLGMTVGKILVENKGRKMVDGKEVWHFHARFKSAPFYSNLYELDETVDTYVTTDQFLSSRYSLIQRESKQDIDDLQLYDRDQLKTFWFYHRKKSNGKVKNKKEEKPIPYFSIDPFSVLFLYQGLPLKNGDIYEIPIVNKGKVLILRSEIEGREKIKTDKGTKKAIRIHATTKYTGETLKSGELYFWFSDDERRTLLKAQAKIKIGSVTADIVDD